MKKSTRERIAVGTYAAVAVISVAVVMVSAASFFAVERLVVGAAGREFALSAYAGGFFIEDAGAGPLGIEILPQVFGWYSSSLPVFFKRVPTRLGFGSASHLVGYPGISITRVPSIPVVLVLLPLSVLCALRLRRHLRHYRRRHMGRTAQGFPAEANVP
jgi:hypothetical protein